MISKSRALSLVLATSALAVTVACSSAGTEEPTTTTGTSPGAEAFDDYGMGESAVITKIERDGSFWIEENLNELLDPDKEEMIKEAIGVATGRFEKVAPGLGVTEAGSDMVGGIDYAAMTKQADGLLRERAEALANHGIHWSQIIPTAAVIVVGGSWTKDLKIFNGGGGSLMFVFVPKWVGHVIPGSREVKWRFKFDVGMTALGNFNALGASAGAGAGLESVASIPKGRFRLGAGLVWGELQHAADLRGLVVGISGSTPWVGVANNFKVLGFVDPGRLKIRNIVGTFSREWGGLPTEAWNASLVIGAALNVESTLKLVFEAFGMTPQGEGDMGRSTIETPERVTVLTGRGRPQGGWTGNDPNKPVNPANPVTPANPVAPVGGASDAGADR
ncbi:MAG: hypothetical protein U0169_26265 [Polyangiaceae bacterium]